jgi:hypothetical protein
VVRRNVPHERMLRVGSIPRAEPVGQVDLVDRSDLVDRVDLEIRVDRVVPRGVAVGS